MQREIVLLFTLIVLGGISTNYAYSQDVQLATFQETVQIIIDKNVSQNVIASISLQSTSIQEIRIPAQLEQQIREDRQVTAVIFTNQDECIIGVVDRSCIVMNIAADPKNEGIFEIQDAAKAVSEKYIDEINQVFGTRATFHSVYLQSGDEASKSLEAITATTDKGVISAVYTMPTSDTSSIYEKISAILIPRVIRDSGGFYDIAKEISYDENASMTFTMVPLESKSLLQLKLSVDYPNGAAGISEISPLEFLNTESINRSDYFSTGFYPLNSLIQVVVLSPENTNISKVKGNILTTQIVDGEKIPESITEQGWIFDPDQGRVIQGKYIFGEETTTNKENLEFSLSGTSTQTERSDPPTIDPSIQTETPELDESMVVIIIISIAAIIAAVFYLKGYRR